MDGGNYWVRLRGGRYTRRGVLHAGALGVAGLAGVTLLGCAGNPRTASRSVSGKSGASQTPQTGGIFNVAVNSNIAVLDPQGRRRIQ